MSTAEIIRELPRLTESERREVCEKLLELIRQDEDVKACDEAAIEGARLLDGAEEATGRERRVG